MAGRRFAFVRMACLAALLAAGASSATHAQVPKWDVLWSRTTGAWLVELIKLPTGVRSCVWSTFDAAPPHHARRLSFLLSTDSKELGVFISDRLDRLQDIKGLRTYVQFGGPIYQIQTSQGIPLIGDEFPGGMIIGHVSPTNFLDFGLDFASSNKGRLTLADGTVWRLNMSGSAAALINVSKCFEQTKVV